MDIEEDLTPRGAIDDAGHGPRRLHPAQVDLPGRQVGEGDRIRQAREVRRLVMRTVSGLRPGSMVPMASVRASRQVPSFRWAIVPSTLTCWTAGPAGGGGAVASTWAAATSWRAAQRAPSDSVRRRAVAGATTPLEIAELTRRLGKAEPAARAAQVDLQGRGQRARQQAEFLIQGGKPGPAGRAPGVAPLQHYRHRPLAA